MQSTPPSPPQARITSGVFPQPGKHPVYYPNGQATGVFASSARNAKRLTAKLLGKMWAKASLKKQRARGLR